MAKTISNLLMSEEEGVTPQGKYSAWATGDGMRAAVMMGNTIIKQFRGETAYEDAVREAGDLNIRA